MLRLMLLKLPLKMMRITTGSPSNAQSAQIINLY